MTRRREPAPSGCEKELAGPVLANRAGKTTRVLRQFDSGTGSRVGIVPAKEIAAEVRNQRDVEERSVGGQIFFEIGYNQESSVKDILAEGGFFVIETILDLAEHRRCIVAQWV